MTQKTKAQITSAISSSFPTTGTGAITAAIQRSFLTDYTDSVFDLVEWDGGTTMGLNPNSLANVSYTNGVASSRFTYASANDIVFLLKTVSGSVDSLGGESDANFGTKVFYDGTTTGNLFNLRTMNTTNRLRVGFSSPANGSVLCENTTVQVYDYNSTGGSAGVSEIGSSFNVINCVAANTNDDAHYWLTDWSLHGPNSGQEKLMAAVLFAAKYNSTETVDADHHGFYGWVVTSRPGSGGGAEDKAGLTSYRGRAAFCANGFAGAVSGGPTDGTQASATDAWQYCFAAGLFGGPWLGVARSRYTTAFYARDFTGYGLEIDAANPTAGTGHAIFIHSDAGNVGIGTTPSSSIPVLISSPDNEVGLRIFSSDAGATQMGVLDLHRQSASPAASDLISAVYFRGRNASASDIIYTQIQGRIDDTTAGSEDGSLLIRAFTAGSSGIVGTFNGAGLNLASGGALKINSTQVVGARDTGWTAMTGSADKGTSYDTSSITLAQLAGRVMSLQAALTTHGLLGA